ncbi:MULTISPECIES: helix-turn-helix domain-containing protein [Arthrobacter]|uniref:Helix-turn-helix domain-containing protein n=2 Tax=Arthrobacter TaxID=1663 RepID=A0ABU9KJX2_9MICC|nr:helix-turn-helix domain-containing protein [Arthrobacter sp. YJM1]MDP5226507.1 helix-turn-helix domain-containing protein [Arthrobacter sp. YJM1]
MSDPQDAVSSEVEPGVGERLRVLRQAAGISLRHLAKELGVSPSAVSQIERGKLQPSLGRVIAMTEALGVPLSSAFSTGDGGASTPGHDDVAVARAGEIQPTSFGKGVSLRRLSPKPVEQLEFFESIYPPGSASNDGAMVHHEGFEMGTVTSGELTVQVDGESVILREGDSIAFPSMRPHLISNHSRDTRAVATWIIFQSPGSSPWVFPVKGDRDVTPGQ